MYSWLTSKTLQELQGLQQLAGEAYQRLAFGGAPRVVVDQNGERVEFTAASKESLNSYLLALSMAIQAKTQIPVGLTRPLSFWF